MQKEVPEITQYKTHFIKETKQNKTIEKEIKGTTNMEFGMVFILGGEMGEDHRLVL